MKIPKNVANALVWTGTICIVLAFLIPIYAYACYTVPLADDFSMVLPTWRAWRETGNLFSVITVAFKWAVQSYMTWSGDYVCMFLQTLPIGLGNYRLYFLSAWIGITILVIAIYYATKIFLVDYLYADKKQWFCISSLVLIFALQFLPDLYDAFYWYTTLIAYTFSFAVKLILVASIFKQLFLVEHIGSASNIALLVMSFMAAGFECSFTQTSYFLIITAYFVYCLFAGEKRIISGIYWLVTTIGWGIALLAPGNMARQSANYGETTGVITVVWESLNRGLISISDNIDLPLLLVTLVLIPSICKITKESRCEYRLPGLFTLFSIGIYASSYAPWIFSRGVEAPSPYGGDSGYITNVFWMTFVILWFVNIVYWIGWVSKNIVSEFRDNEQEKVLRLKTLWYGTIIVLMLFWSIRLEHIMEYASPRVLWHLLNGNAQRYYMMMESREDILLTESDGIIIVPNVEMPIPTGGAGDIIADETNWINKAVEAYYELDYGVRTEE